MAADVNVKMKMGMWLRAMFGLLSGRSIVNLLWTGLPSDAHVE